MLNNQAINCDARLYMNDSQKLLGTSASYRMPIQAPTTFGSDAQNISMYGQTIGSAPPQSTDLNKLVTATIDQRMLKKANMPLSRFKLRRHQTPLANRRNIPVPAVTGMASQCG